MNAFSTLNLGGRSFLGITKSVVSLGLLAIILACATNRDAGAADFISGTAQDANTDEPIVGAWIFETERQSNWAADTPRVDKVRVTRSDADGRFQFQVESQSFLFSKPAEKRYVFFNESYGLIRLRADPRGKRVTVRPSLRDAHLRQADTHSFCRSPYGDEMTRKIKELACPAPRMQRFADESPRATGDLDERGRRDGPWTFFREDGSAIAWGEYRSGAAIGDWRFQSPGRIEVSPH